MGLTELGHHVLLHLLLKKGKKKSPLKNCNKSLSANTRSSHLFVELGQYSFSGLYQRFHQHTFSTPKENSELRCCCLMKRLEIELTEVPYYNAKYNPLE